MAPQFWSTINFNRPEKRAGFFTAPNIWSRKDLCQFMIFAAFCGVLRRFLAFSIGDDRERPPLSSPQSPSVQPPPRQRRGSPPAALGSPPPPAVVVSPPPPPTCRQHVGPTAENRHIWPTGPRRADTNLFPTHFFVSGIANFLQIFSSTRVRLYAQPAKNLYIQRSSILSTIHDRAVVDNNNTQQST